MNAKATCRACGAELEDENWYPSHRKKRMYTCKKCSCKQAHKWRKANPEKVKAQNTRSHRKKGHRPLNENKECTSYLGVHIAEQVLSQAFKDVKRMPMNNPGYDVICNRNKLIDIKSSCFTGKHPHWSFHIGRNTTADFFLCLAFDNREDLHPLHIWLLPGGKFNHLMNAAIRPSTIHKWDAYRLDISKISDCCDAMR